MRTIRDLDRRCNRNHSSQHAESCTKEGRSDPADRMPALPRRCRGPKQPNMARWLGSGTPAGRHGRWTRHGKKLARFLSSQYRQVISNSIASIPFSLPFWDGSLSGTRQPPPPSLLMEATAFLFWRRVCFRFWYTAQACGWRS